METQAGLLIAAVGVAIAGISGIVGVVWRLSAKLYQVEIWARDEFVRKGSFETVVARLERSMELMGNKVEAAVEKMATEIKNLPHREH